MFVDIKPISKKDPGSVNIRVRIEAYEPCSVHGSGSCSCEKTCIGIIEQGDLATKQFAQLIQLNILDSNQTIKDIDGDSNEETANTSSGTITIMAGTDNTAADVTDFSLGAQTETVSGTVNSYSGSGVSGGFTVTGTITAEANRAYTEVGLGVTVNSSIYLICRDVFSTYNVSDGGTLAVTYTITCS
jgi:hypothetical protein